MIALCSHVGKDILLSHRVLLHSVFSDSSYLRASVHNLGKGKLVDLLCAAIIVWTSSRYQVDLMACCSHQWNYPSPPCRGVLNNHHFELLFHSDCNA